MLDVRPSRASQVEGGIERLPALQALAMRGIGDAGAAIASASLTSLTTAVRPPCFPCMHTDSVEPQVGAAMQPLICLVVFQTVIGCMACLQGIGYLPQDHLPLGCMPKLTVYHLRPVLELTPALLRDIISLQTLQVQHKPSHPAIYLPRLLQITPICVLVSPIFCGAGTCGFYLLYEGRYQKRQSCL